MLTNPRDAFRCQSRSPNIVPFHMLGIVSSCVTVILSLKRRCFYDIQLQKCRDLEIGSEVTQGHWKWHHLKDCVWFPISVLNAPFWDIRLQNCCDLENWVRGPSRSLEMSPFDSAYDFLLTFYSDYGSILFRFWDIQCREMSYLEIGIRGHSGSLNLVPFDRLGMVSY